ncbi:3-deoxy-D-manno-octulosonic acid kinase [Isoalcanivorax indicus]|uniref:3-deoxy-D-manno-octulosonic acid kinase n=1 Tax=Isoalcanivorax indicus TaxID=2202653 RepID=UPI000DB97AD3|nr:3-deoxy-D-manno-octulosonic acid kinase [Isoalcanivorax indicus]
MTATATLQRLTAGRNRFLYDPACFSDFSPACFDPEHWYARDAVTGTATGRGTTWFVQDGDRHMVLRHYRRGGLLAPLLGDRYLRQPEASTRAMREFRLLAMMRDAGLPVPRPCAAALLPDTLLTYRAALMIERIPDARDLVALLQEGPLPAAVWAETGRVIARLHTAGIWHADLNAHNILLDAQDRVWLIDFDKCRERAPGRWQQANLDRLQRSLRKEAGLHAHWHVQHDDVAHLLKGYADTFPL